MKRRFFLSHISSPTFQKVCAGLLLSTALTACGDGQYFGKPRQPSVSGERRSPAMNPGGNGGNMYNSYNSGPSAPQQGGNFAYGFGGPRPLPHEVAQNGGFPPTPTANNLPSLSPAAGQGGFASVQQAPVVAQALPPVQQPQQYAQAPQPQPAQQQQPYAQQPQAAPQQYAQAPAPQQPYAPQPQSQQYAQAPSYAAPVQPLPQHYAQAPEQVAQQYAAIAPAAGPAHLPPLAQYAQPQAAAQPVYPGPMAQQHPAPQSQHYASVEPTYAPQPMYAQQPAPLPQVAVMAREVTPVALQQQPAQPLQQQAQADSSFWRDAYAYGQPNSPQNRAYPQLGEVPQAPSHRELEAYQREIAMLEQERNRNIAVREGLVPPTMEMQPAPMPQALPPSYEAQYAQPQYAYNYQMEQAPQPVRTGPQVSVMESGVVIPQAVPAAPLPAGSYVFSGSDGQRITLSPPSSPSAVPLPSSRYSFRRGYGSARNF